MTTSTTSTRSANTIDQHIGNRIRMRRNELRLSQTYLGEVLGVSFQQIQKYELGTNRISSGRLPEVAKALNVQVGFFYQGAPSADMKRNDAYPPAIMDDFLASKDGLRIASAFVRIKDPGVRFTVATAIAALIGEIAR